VLSPFGRTISPGCCKHARASAVFTTPTINGYKRYRSYSLAPDRAIWGRDNRGVMIRVLGGPAIPRRGWKTASASPPPIPISTWPRRFSRASTASIASSIPGRPPTRPMRRKAALLPKTLREAVFALKDDPFFREALGAEFVDYYVHIKNAEIERFQAEVSDWEQREYFEMF
jgi:glutamine synthetase